MVKKLNTQGVVNQKVKLKCSFDISIIQTLHLVLRVSEEPLVAMQPRVFGMELGTTFFLHNR